MITLALLCAFTPAEALREAVAEHESVPVEDVEIGEIGVLVNAPSNTPWAVRLPEATGLCGGVPVVLSAEGRRYSVRAPVTVWRDVPVSRTAVAPGDQVTIASARASCAALHGETVVDPSQTWEASVSLAAGEPVTTARVHPWPDVRKGDTVRIEAGSGVLTVERWRCSTSRRARCSPGSTPATMS